MLSLSCEFPYLLDADLSVNVSTRIASSVAGKMCNTFSRLDNDGFLSYMLAFISRHNQRPQIMVTSPTEGKHLNLAEVDKESDWMYHSLFQ